MTGSTRAWLATWWARLAPAVFLAFPVALAQHGLGQPGTAAGVALTLVALGCLAVAFAALTPYVAGRPPPPCAVRRRASHLPPPLAVDIPHVPHGPRAPGLH